MISRNLFSRLWGMPQVQGLDPDSAEALAAHRGLLRSKKFLHRLYADFYRVFQQQAAELTDKPGQLLEIGSGAGFLKEVLPDIITSDVCPSPAIDRVIGADHLPFNDGDLKGIFLLNVLHHIPDPEAFLREANRCLSLGGRVVLIEPFNSLWGRIFYKSLHHEPFDDRASRWTLSSSGRMSGANVALPWTIFWRDRALFEQRFPHLRIRSINLHTVTAYAVSGGLSFRAVVPAVSYPFFRKLDAVLSKFRSLFPIFQTVILEKQ